MCVQSGYAQEDNYFEGEIAYRNFENHNKLVLKLSKGMAYNGARDVKILMKGANMHIIDESLHMHTLLLPEENKAVIYNDLLKRGQEFPFNAYVNTYLSALSPNDRVINGMTIPASSTVGNSGNVKEYMDQSCDIYSGKISANNGGVTTDVELWISPNYSIYKSYWAFLNGIEVPGIALKWVLDQKGSVPILGKMSSYIASEVKELTERPIADEEMQVPADYNIVASTSPFKVLGLYKDMKKYLTKNKMYPTQQESVVTYKIDDEWEF